MRKLMKGLVVGLCCAILCTGVPVWGTENTIRIILVDNSRVTESINKLNINSSPEEIQNVQSEIEKWGKELAEQEAAIDAQMNAAETGGITGVAGTMSQSSLSQIMSDIDLGPSGSLSYMFAKLQLAQAGIAKNQVESCMTQIVEIQEHQKNLAEMLNKLRAMQTASKLTLPEDMKNELVQLGICPNNYSILMKSEVTKEDINDLIRMAEMRLEQIGMETQKLMVYVQDFLGQYNSYLEETNPPISNANQTLTSIARGMTLSGDGNSMLFTTGIVGAGIGVIGTLLVQKFTKKRKKG